MSLENSLIFGKSVFIIHVLTKLDHIELHFLKYRHSPGIGVEPGVQSGRRKNIQN